MVNPGRNQPTKAKALRKLGEAYTVEELTRLLRGRRQSAQGHNVVPSTFENDSQYATDAYVQGRADMDYGSIDSKAPMLGNGVDLDVAMMDKPSRALRRRQVEHRSLISRYSETLAPSSLSRVDDDDDDDDTLSTLEPPMQSFKMHEEEKVEAFLLERIDALQQLSLKHICKEWIKVICPKKQANYPYRNTKIEKPEVPGWWPDEELCEWREPDHVKKDARNRLVLHLLRLRPTAAQLKEWNGDNFQASDMHKFEDWTTFLESVLPDLDKILPVTEARVHKRRQLLKEIYTVARMEEEWKKFGMNGQYHYKEEVKASAVVPMKRQRRAASMSSTHIAGGEDLEPRVLPQLRDEQPVKRPRRQAEQIAATPSSTMGSEFDPTGHPFSPKTSRGLARRMSSVTLKQQSTAPTPAHHDVEQMDVKPSFMKWCGTQTTEPTVYGDVGLAPPQRSSVVRRNAVHGTALPQYDEKVGRYPQFHQHPRRQWTGPDFSPATSFGSSSTEQTLPPAMYQAYPHTPLIHAGIHDYGHQMPQMQHYVQAFSAEVPEPQFDTVPNTPVFSGMALTYPMLSQDYQQPYMQQPHPFTQNIDQSMATMAPAQQSGRRHDQAMPQQFVHGLPMVDPPQHTGLDHHQATLMPQQPTHGMPIMAPSPHPTYANEPQFACHPHDQLYHY
ncbi:hypothetical protein LTR27_008433 [Elasticomyces elasticus]|nr:hypothetical protein LTR27_008433 [Elasticomyces elasticus]